MTAAEKLAPRLGLASEIARASGLDRRWVGKILRGEGNPTLGTIERIAGALALEAKEVTDFIYAKRSRRREEMKKLIIAAALILATLALAQPASAWRWCPTARGICNTICTQGADSCHERCRSTGMFDVDYDACMDGCSQEAENCNGVCDDRWPCFEAV